MGAGTPFYESVRGERADTTLMARVQSYLWVSGGLLMFAGLAVPRPPGADELALVVLAVSSIVGGGILRLLAARVTLAVLFAGCLVGIFFISVGIYFWHNTGTEVDLLYIWIVLYAFYFFGRTWGLAATAATGVAYGVTLAYTDPAGSPALAWLDLIGTTLGAGLVVAALVERVRGLARVLGRAAETDTLTGLVNRRGFESVLDAELAHARLADHPLALVIADLDHFKRINDEFGHPVGDSALRHLADCLRGVVRAGDVVARVGGEEFVVTAAHAGPEAGRILAEKLRRAVERAPHPVAGPMTISLGVAVAPDDGHDRASLFAAADAALYRAKRDGRNCVRSALPPEQPSPRPRKPAPDAPAPVARWART